MTEETFDEQAQQPEAPVGGIDPAAAQQFLEPMVAKAVGDTLSKMNLNEQLSKLVNDVITKVRVEIKEALPKIVENQIIQMAQSQGGQGESQSPEILQKRGDALFTALMQKIIGGDSTGLDALLKQQAQLGQLIDVFTKPMREERERTMREINLLFSMGSKGGITPPEVLSKLQGQIE